MALTIPKIISLELKRAKAITRNEIAKRIEATRARFSARNDKCEGTSFVKPIISKLNANKSDVLNVLNTKLVFCFARITF